MPSQSPVRGPFRVFCQASLLLLSLTSAPADGAASSPAALAMPASRRDALAGAIEPAWRPHEPIPCHGTFPRLHPFWSLVGYTWRTTPGFPKSVMLRAGLDFYRFGDLSDCPELPVADTPEHATVRVLAAVLGNDRGALDELLAADERWLCERKDGGLDSLDREAHRARLDHWADPDSLPWNVVPRPMCCLFATAPLRYPLPVSRDESDETHALVVIESLLVSPRFRWNSATTTEWHRLGLLLVRGDVAVLRHPERRDATRWYVQGWFEGLPGSARLEILAAALAAPATAPRAGAAEALRLSVRRTSPLRAWPVRFALTLPVADPATLSMYDVAGRKVWRRDLERPAPGEHGIELSDREMPPGVYWLRLRQSGHETGLRLVVLR